MLFKFLLVWYVVQVVGYVISLFQKRKRVVIPKSQVEYTLTVLWIFLAINILFYTKCYYTFDFKWVSIGMILISILDGIRLSFRILNGLLKGEGFVSKTINAFVYVGYLYLITANGGFYVV